MTDAINTTGQKFFTYPRWVTRFLQSDDAPTLPVLPAEISTAFQAERVLQSAGGSTLDSAQIKWSVTSPLINRTQTSEFAYCVEVFLPDQTTRLHFGDYVTETEAVNEGGESLTAQSHLRKWHFGTPWIGQVWYDKATDSDVQVSEPPVFNPVVDGVVLANRSSLKRKDGKDAFVWCHPEQLLTTEAETYSGQTAETWDLKQAVQAICWEMNRDESFIDNPDATSLDKLDGAPVLENVRLGMDVSLPKALDQLLHPLGYNWFIDYQQTKCRIDFFQIGSGDEKELLFQAPGSVYDPTLSNVNDYRVTRQIGDAPNAVYVLGDYERREITLPLWRAWPEADDSLTAADLTKSDTGSQYESKPHAWRLWVANEAGDYKDTRPEILDPPDLSGVFTNYVPHRREIEDPISYDGEASSPQRRQIHLEFSTDGGTTWNLVPPEFGQPYITPGQIGVLFTGDTPPTTLIDAGSNAQLRITGTVQGDFRLQEYAQPTPQAANGRTNILTLDVPGKFQDRQVQTDGEFASSLAGGAAGADEADDSTEIGDFARAIRDQNTCAELDCRFVLPGIHTEYKIGDLITKIAGREIDLDSCPGDGNVGVGTGTVGGTLQVGPVTSTRYPQIVKREFQYSPHPQTILTVDRVTGRRTR